YVDDTVQGIEKCITDPNSINDIFNIAANPDEEITISNLGTKIWKLINGEDSIPKINFIPYSTFGNYEDVLRRVPDISKIKSKLNYNPKYSLTEGLKLTIEWQKTKSSK